MKALRLTTGEAQQKPRLCTFKRVPHVKPMTPIDYLNLHCAKQAINEKTARWQRYFEPVPELSKGLPVPFLGIMVLIWQLRDKDLQLRYSLKTRASRLEFIGWCIVHGCKEYRALREADALWKALSQPVTRVWSELPDDDPGHAISWKIYLLVSARSDLQFDLFTRAGREALLAWYLLHGRNEIGFGEEDFAPWQNIWFFSPSSIKGLNRLQSLVYQARPDVRQAFPLPDALTGYIQWIREFLVSEPNLLNALRSHSHDILLAPTIALSSPFGVNVVGYAFGQLGIGEDARMAAKSLLSCSVPFNLLDFPPGDDIPQNERSMQAYVGTEAQYAVNMFCLSALEHGRFFAERGSKWLEGRINIGYWPWELSKWPEEWQHLMALVDEVWVSSPHTFESVSAAASVSVRLMPMAVELDEVAPLSRADFDLPESACLFLFAFDLNSSAKRKNPKACVQAFLNAFPESDNIDYLGADKVGLVIKVHPPKTPNRDWDELKQLQGSDERIHLIEQTLSKSDLLALYKVCDCFVSLHRAEGFGRCLAEAMLLGRPLITTDYSGNLAFTSHENALLVKYQLIDLKSDDYPYGWGQQWADPNIEDAARQMRRVQQRQKQIRTLAARGQTKIVQLHHPKVIGARYAQTLAALFEERQSLIGQNYLNNII